MLLIIEVFYTVSIIHHLYSSSNVIRSVGFFKSMYFHIAIFDTFKIIKPMSPYCKILIAFICALFTFNSNAQSIGYKKENVFKISNKRCLYAIQNADTLFFQSSVIDIASNTFFIDTLIVNPQNEYLSKSLIAHQIDNIIYVMPNQDSTLFYKYFCSKNEIKNKRIEVKKVFKLINTKQFELYEHLEKGRLQNNVQYRW